MSRPGPRPYGPYERVRRAWHSVRHQPMRGSLIQEIFRIGNEVHGPGTRKNKEWQEKLPIIVLKAEEIMYSKANSEAEYMGLKTLWDRVNDAMDTIIRRDDALESGDLLQPCIEAALNLGCIPRRASRSQRHSNPGFYLSSNMKEETAASPKFPDSNKVQLGSSAHLLPSPPTYPNNPRNCTSHSAPWYPGLMPASTIESGCLQNAVSIIPDSSYEQKDSISFSKHDCSSKDPLLSVQGRGLSKRTETFNWSNLGHVYPLCYINSKSKESSQPTSQNLHVSLSNSATTLSSRVPSINGIPPRFLQNFLDSSSRDASNISSDLGGTSDKPSNIGLDLSLRLGLPSPPSLGEESAWTFRVEDESSSFGDTTDELLESCSSKGSSEGEGMFHIEASDRKRRAPIGCSSQDAYICWNQNISRHQLFGSSQAREL